MFGGSGVGVVPRRKFGGKDSGDDMVATTSVFGIDFNQKEMEGVKEKGKGLFADFSQESGKGVQEMASKKDPSGSSVAACREDLEGGGWTVVAKRKLRSPLKNQLGKARGFPYHVRQQLGGGAVGQGKESGGGHEQSGRRSMLVYTKGGKTSPLIPSSSLGNASLISKVPPSIPDGSGGRCRRWLICRGRRGAIRRLVVLLAGVVM